MTSCSIYSCLLPSDISPNALEVYPCCCTWQVCILFMAEYYSCVCVCVCVCCVCACTHAHTTSSLSFHLWMDTYVVSIPWLLSVMLQWRWCDDFLSITQPLSGRAVVQFKGFLARKFMLSYHSTSVGSSLWNIGTPVSSHCPSGYVHAQAK